MTDDLDMGAILNEAAWPIPFAMPFEAGNDIAMICHRLDMVEVSRRAPGDVAASVAGRRFEKGRSIQSEDAAAGPMVGGSLCVDQSGDLGLRVATLGEERAANPKSGRWRQIPSGVATEIMLADLDTLLIIQDRDLRILALRKDLANMPR